MMESNSRNIVDLKQNNLREILRIIKAFPDITKNEIADKISMTAVSAHNLLSELLEIGICKPSGMASSSGGRKAVRYRFNKDYGYIIGVNIFRTNIHFTAYDMENNLLLEKMEICDITARDETVKKLLAGVSELMQARELADMNCLCIGVVVPGRVNGEGRIVLMPDASIWCDYPLKEVFEERFHIATYVDNDNNANMLSSKWMNMINEKANAVFLSITEGVGVGVIISRGLFRGAQDNGSEFGHTVINVGGRLCRCGNNGCLQAYISDQAIVDSLAWLFNTKYPDLANRAANITEIAEYAHRNNCHDLYTAFYNAAEYISIAISNIIKIYDPEIIIVNNSWLKVFPEILDDIKLKVAKYCSSKRFGSTEIIINVDKNVINMAPALMALDNYLSNFEIMAIKMPLKLV